MMWLLVTVGCVCDRMWKDVSGLGQYEISAVPWRNEDRRGLVLQELYCVSLQPCVFTCMFVCVLDHQCLSLCDFVCLDVL